MVRLLLTWKEKGWAFELHPGLNTFGRNPTNEHRVGDSSVSSFHVEVQVDEGEIRVRDLGSTNGTFINGERVREAVLPPGGSLRMGTVELELAEVPVAHMASPAPARAAGESARCAYHPEIAATFQCENCGGVFCGDCVKVAGHDRVKTMTFCPVCNGQCNFMTTRLSRGERNPSLLARLTQTLKIPFPR